ncbi:MAG: hypothetical protein LBV72_11475 [Tannerella sp.]|jgi:hypothetical protein|nr:hypothetical protein [Tannerella sp.]
MSEIQSINIHKPTKPSIDKEFIELSYYSSFLQQIGLKEIENSEQYLLSHRDGKNWTPQIEDIANVMQQLQQQEHLSSKEMLSMLSFVLEKLDRPKGIPQYVGSYMCRSAITRTVLQRFNETIGVNCTSLTELSYKISDNIAEANETFNTLRLCDPAMSSGYFLITLLNEFIAIKSQLGILADMEGNPLFQYKVSVKDNELVIFDKKQFTIHTFDSSCPESERIQKALQHEKQLIIENCLFGVDIDPTAVTICRLRLWLEVLKHTCWKDNDPLVLPLLDCNVRCGDALVSRFSLQEDLRNVFKRIGYTPVDYKNLAIECKKAQTNEERNALRELIDVIKKKIQQEITWDDRNNEDMLKWQRELEALKAPSLFEMDEAEAKIFKSKLLDAQTMVNKYKQKIEDIKSNPIFEKAIEWRYEFPELLNTGGDFTGFDFVIGNPPDTQSQIMGDTTDIFKQMNYRAYKRTGDVSSLFYELGNKILRPEYFLSYINSNSWMKSVSASKMRQYLMEDTNPLLMIEFCQTVEIDNDLADKGIILLQKARNLYRMMSCQIKEDFEPTRVTLDDYLLQHATLVPVETNINGSDNLITSFAILSDTEKQIKGKIEHTGIPLESWDIQMFTGIKTGYNDAFIVDSKTKDEFVLADYKNTDIIKPLLLGKDIHRYAPEQSDRWLLYLPWHFPLLYDRSINSASERAEMRFRQQYPVIHDHLLKYKDQLVARDQEVGVSYEWYALQRYGGSNEWDDFTLQKIVWKREAPTSSFCLDYRGCAIMDSMCFITGQHLKYLLGVLNSKLGCYMLRDSPRLPNGDIQISILTLDALKIPVPNIKVESDVISLVNRRTTDIHQSEYEELDRKIDQHIYDMYGLNDEERAFIEANISYT